MKCDECGGLLVKTRGSEFLVCSNCGLLSNFRILDYDINKNKSSKYIKNKVKIAENTYEDILKKLNLPFKYKRKITSNILIKAKYLLESKNSIKEVKKEIYKTIREANKYEYEEFIKISKEYKNIPRVFLNGNGSEVIFEAISLLYYAKKRKLDLSFEKVSKIFNIAKNNLFRRYKEFETRIKIYEKQSLKNLIIMKLIGQYRLAQLSLKELALIANVRHDSARALQMRIKKKIPNIVDEKSILGLLIRSSKGTY